MTARYPISHPKLLLVEGRHDRDVFTAWLEAIRPKTVQVTEYGGKDNLRRALKLLVDDEHFHTLVSLVVVRDADLSASSAFESVRDALRDLVPGIVPPEAPFQLQPAPKLSTGIVILPDGEHPGGLEDLLLATRVADPAHPLATGYVDDVVAALAGTKARTGPPPHWLGKSRAQAYLASWEQPGLDVGKAALRNAWDFTHPVLDRLRAFLLAI